MNSVFCFSKDFAKAWIDKSMAIEFVHYQIRFKNELRGSNNESYIASQ